jgi:hypothetical protein
MQRIPVGFDEDTFQQIRGLAKITEVSFAEQVRQLVEFGLELVVLSEQERRGSAANARVEKR